MGWTVFNGMPRGGMQKAIDDEINSGGCKVIESVFLGRDYYAAVLTPEGAVIAAVAIVEGSGYKLMDESMNPYAYSCPAKILDMLTPAPDAWTEQLAEWSATWRARCRERLALEASDA